MASKKMRDCFWIWGHPAGCHDQNWGIEPLHSRMTPCEGAYYLGARNCIMVCYGDEPKPPFDQEAMALDNVHPVPWVFGFSIRFAENHTAFPFSYRRSSAFSGSCPPLHKTAHPHRSLIRFAASSLVVLSSIDTPDKNSASGIFGVSTLARGNSSCS